MKGLEILGPVFTAFKPGTFFTNTSIMFVSAVCSIAFGETLTIATGFSLILVAFETPVTTTSFNVPFFGFSKTS